MLVQQENGLVIIVVVTVFLVEDDIGEGKYTFKKPTELKTNRKQHVRHVSATQTEITENIITECSQFFLCFSAIQYGNGAAIVSENMRIFPEILLKIQRRIITSGSDHRMHFGNSSRCKNNLFLQFRREFHQVICQCREQSFVIRTQFADNAVSGE